jgi:hypothetical protein
VPYRSFLSAAVAFVMIARNSAGVLLDNAASRWPSIGIRPVNIAISRTPNE